MEKKIALDKKQIEMIKKESKNIKEMLSILEYSLKQEEINEGLKENIPNLINSYLEKIKETIGWTGQESNREKEMNISIGQYYQEQISNLKEAAVKQNSILTIPALTRDVFEKIDTWWDAEGFNYTTQKKIDQTGSVEVELGILLDKMSMLLNPTSSKAKKEEKTKIEYMKEKGYVLEEKKSVNNAFLIDDDKNRKLLREEIKKAFPSARINSIANQYWEDENGEEILIIKSISVRIKNIADIANLQVEEKEFAIE